MNLTSATFFTAAFLIFCSFFRRGSDVFSPARIFGITWCIVFGLVCLKFSRLQFHWTSLQWILALMGPASFLLGLFFAYVINADAKMLSMKQMRTRLKEYAVDESKLFSLIIVVFLLYCAGYLTIYLVKGYVPMFSFKPSSARIDYFIFGVGLFIHHMPIVFFFTVLYHLVVEGKKGKKNILKFITIFTVLTFIMLLQRYPVMMISVMVFAFLYYTTRYIKFQTVFLFLSAAVALVYSVATVRAGQLVQLYLYTTSQMKFPFRYAIFTEPYMYVVMNVENLVNGMKKLEVFSYGYYSFDFVFSITGLKYWMKEYWGLVDNPFLFSGYNTYTLFWSYYRDFGIIGISLFPMAGGLLVGAIYYAMRRKPTIGLLTTYSMIVFIMGMSFFVNLLSFLWFVYIVAWFALILKLIRVRTQPL